MITLLACPQMLGLAERIAAAHAGGNGQLLDQPCKNLTPFGVRRPFFSFNG